MSDSTLAGLAQELKRLTGIQLGPEKYFLLGARLNPLVRSHEFTDLEELLSAIRALPGAEDPLSERFIDALTINETSFFRESTPFALLTEKLLPEHLASKGIHSQGLKIWSAGCSTGQEAYSIALSIQHKFPGISPANVRIVGTDISEDAIHQARQGRYNGCEIKRGLPTKLQEEFFEENEGMWHTTDSLRRWVSFQKQNLLEIPPQHGLFDIVFCRHVAVYFDEKDRATLFENIARHMAPGASLVCAMTDMPETGAPQLQRLNFRGMPYYQKPLQEERLL
jgi:chemotaxis protein methyltransferase CheR